MNKGMHVDCDAKGRRAMLAALTHRLNGAGGAQSIVEFAMALPILLVTLVVGVQFAIIGATSLALGQVNYQGARYAAINTTATQSDVKTYILSVAAPSITANNGARLTGVTLSPAPPCAFGATVTVSLTYNSTPLIVLPNPFFGINFPTSLTSSESAFCEGSGS